MQASVDSPAGLFQHECAMGSALYERERRSSRLFRRVRVLVSGRDRMGRHFREHCGTIVVSAHGALLRVSRALDLDAMLTLTNPVTLDEQECRVAYVGNESEETWRIGVEFLTPAPHFWGIDFAQSDGGPAPPSSRN